MDFPKKQTLKAAERAVDDLWDEFDAWIHKQVLGFGDAKSTVKEWYRFLLKEEEK